MSEKVVRIVIQAGDLSAGAREAQKQIAAADRSIKKAYTSAKSQHASFSRSIMRTGYLLSLTVQLTFNFLDILGIEMPRLQEALSRNMISYVQQLIMIAGAQMSAGNVMGAVLISTAALALQTKIELWREESMNEVASVLSKAQNSLSALATASRSTYCLLYTSPSPRDRS